MSRSMTPPDTLSGEQVHTMRRVRRDIWVSGAQGLATGAVAGLALHSVAHLGQRRHWWPPLLPPLNRNTLFLSILAGGAWGSFISATSVGKNQVHHLHPIFSVGAASPPPPPPPTYAETLQRAREREEDLRALRLQHTAGTEPVDAHTLDRLERERNRILRRATLSKAMEPGQGGLNDAHGGRWVSDSRPTEDK